MNSDEVQAWFLDILAVIRKGCLLTDTEMDESVVDAAMQAISNATVWSWCWLLIGRLFNDEQTLLVADEAPTTELLEAGVSPALIIAIIKMLYDLWQLFKK